MAEVAERFDLPDLMLPDDVAKWLGVSVKAVYHMVNRGEFPPGAVVRIGPRLRFDADELRPWVAEKRGASRKTTR